jgi:formate dehydrogenase subunit delta
MANQIAHQFDHLPAAQATAAVAAHLSSFWAPSMRHDLLICVADEPAALHPTVVEAAAALRQHPT